MKSNQLQATVSVYTIEGKDCTLNQSAIYDWDKYFDDTLDVLHSCDRFFESGKSIGDYHDNFDSKSIFKWMVSVHLTYPD